MIVKIPKPDNVIKYVAFIMIAFAIAGYCLVTGQQSSANFFFLSAIGLALIGILLDPMFEHDSRMDHEKYWVIKLKTWQSMFSGDAKTRHESFFYDKETEKEKTEEDPST